MVLYMDLTSPETDISDQTTLIQLRLWTIPVLVVLIVLAVGMTVLCLNFSYYIVFQNLYYLPIILVCINYPKRGILFTTGISLVYVILMIAIPRNPSLLVPVLIRFVFFELVAAVIVRLCIKKTESETAFQLERDALAVTLAAQKDFIESELEKNRRLVHTFQETDKHDQHLFNQLQVPLLVLNKDLYILRVNNAFSTLVGRQQEDLTGRNLSTIPLLEAAARKPYGKAMELALPDSDGIFHPSLWSFSAVYSLGDPVPAAIVAVGQLLTEQQ